MQAHLNHSRSRRIAAVVIAGCAFGVAGAVTVAADQTPSDTEVRVRDGAALVRWAEDNDVSGLSPASVSPQAAPNYAHIAFERAQIEAWAHSQGMSGLSPASMRPVGD